MLGVLPVCALEVTPPQQKDVPSLSVHDILKNKKFKFLKLLAYPTFDEDGLTFSGVKFMLKFNEPPNLEDSAKLLP